jgi:predicted amidophosphoribosyltransferase
MQTKTPICSRCKKKMALSVYSFGWYCPDCIKKEEVKYGSKV